MKKIEEMSPSQIKYETKRASKKGMTLNEWINHHNEKDNYIIGSNPKSLMYMFILQDMECQVEIMVMHT
jgi:hypothetical protein